MKPVFEESTKIHSAAELDEMVRRAKSEPAAEFEDDEHTMIGNSEELAARSMSVPDAPPAPRASSNIIRRSSAIMAVRAASEPPVATSDVVELEADEDDAFAPWDDAGQRTSPQSRDQLVAALEAATPPAVAAIAPKTEMVVEDLPCLDARLISPTGMPSPIADPRKVNVDRIVAVVAVALLIVAIVLGYRRISALEDELASTKAALDLRSH